MSTVAVHLDRLLEPLADCLSVEVAAKVAGLRADEATQGRIDYLAHRALACNNLAYFLAIEEEDVAGTLALADRAIELAGPCPECLDTHGVALLAAGRADEALAELRRVVGNDPTGLRLYHLARACHAAGDEESALEAWEEARHERELSLQQIPFYEQAQYRAFAELLQKEP